jgi:hypothetical protein
MTEIGKRICIFYPSRTQLPSVGDVIELGSMKSGAVAALGKVLEVKEDLRDALVEIIAGGEEDLL